MDDLGKSSNSLANHGEYREHIVLYKNEVTQILEDYHLEKQVARLLVYSKRENKRKGHQDLGAMTLYEPTSNKIVRKYIGSKLIF